MLISPFSFRRRTSAKTLQNSYPMLWIFICRWLSFSESEILSIGFTLAVFQKLIQRMISTRGILRSVSRQFYIFDLIVIIQRAQIKHSQRRFGVREGTHSSSYGLRQQVRFLHLRRSASPAFRHARALPRSFQAVRCSARCL